MSKTAPSLPCFAQNSPDPRADGAVRRVELRDGTIVIDRAVSGVRMRVAVPVSSYRDLAIRIRMPSGSGELVLRHADRDLDVVLSTGDAAAIARLAREWSQVCGKAIAIERAFVAVQGTFNRQPPRLDQQGSSGRRARRARTIGTGGTGPRIFSHEHEIIARS